MQTKRITLFGGPEDEVVVPWQSMFFGMFDSKNKVIDMRNQEIYTKDYFGLKTLDLERRLIMHQVRNVSHFDWFLFISKFRNNDL